MKGVGKDATKMFDEVHAWVNYEQLLGKCFIGPLRNTMTLQFDASNRNSRTKTINQLASSTMPNGSFRAPFLPILNSMAKSPKQTISTDAGEALMPVIPGNAQNEIVPRFDWIQKTNELSLVFYTKALCNPGVIVQLSATSQSKLKVFIQIEQTLHICEFQLSQDIEWPPSICKVNQETGKIEINLIKKMAALWTNFGSMTRRQTMDLDQFSFLYDIYEKIQFTHDSYALVLKPKLLITQICPIGYHISITTTIEGNDVCSYRHIYLNNRTVSLK